MGGGRDEDSTAVGGRNAATAGVAGATSCVPNDWPYGRLDTESSGGMAPASPQAPPPSFDRRRIGNAIAVGSPGRRSHAFSPPVPRPPGAPPGGDLGYPHVY